MDTSLPQGRMPPESESRVDAVDHGPAPLYPPRTRTGLDPTKGQEFLERLAVLRRAALRQPPAAGQGCLQILDLAQVRPRFGRRWLPLRDKILGIVEAALQRDLGADDAYVALSDTLFYLFRLGIKRPDADRRGLLLAADITERLCGAIPGGVAVALKAAPFDIAQGLAGVTSFAQLKNRVDAFGRMLDDAELRLFLDHADRFEPWFWPTLHLRKGLISAYRLAPMLGGDSPRPVAGLCGASFNGVFDAEVDNWSVQRIGQLLAAPHRQRACLILPIHYETMAAMRLREPFLILCRQLPPCSSRRLIVELLDLPVGLPQARVREIMAYLKPFCLGTIVRLPHDAIFAEHLVNSGVLGLSLDLGGLDPEALATRETIHMLVEAARAQRLRSLLVAAGSVRLCHHALRAGVDQLNGPAFMPPLRQPTDPILIARTRR